jgi:hypothetical protein
MVMHMKGVHSFREMTRLLDIDNGLENCAYSNHGCSFAIFPQRSKGSGFQFESESDYSCPYKPTTRTERIVEG